MEEQINKIEYDNFVHLHVHSTFSFQDGIGLPNQYIKKCKEINQKAIATTDHGNVSSHYKWYKECKKNGIKPILGCELYIKPDNENDEKNYYHLTAVALTLEGYRNLLKIVTEGWKSNKRKPIVSLDYVIQHQKGLMVTSGCPSSRINTLIGKGDIEKAEEELYELKKLIEHFYIEIAPWNFAMAQKLIKPLHRLSMITGIPLVAANDCHYPNKEQNHIQEVLLCIQSNDRMNNPKRWKFDQTDLYLKTRREMEDSFKEIEPDLDFTAALDNTVKIADMVDFEFPQASPLKFPMSEEEKDSKLKEMCIEGLKTRGFIDKKEYVERMEYELDLIIKKNFVDYFLIVSDLVNWAKTHDILVGPARGSAAGSLICYLLRITEVDPLKFGLIFERFIDLNREDLPDIDVDFEDEKRPLIKRYLESKYGENKVSALATYSTFKGKQVVNDLGRVYMLPFDVVTKLKSIIIERSGGDSRASFTIEDTFNQFDIAKEYIQKYPFLNEAKDLEGQLRQMSTHASGIVVSNEPLTDFCAIYQNKGEQTTSLDYYDASSLGLVKIDVLGLNTLTCVAKALRLIKERHNVDVDIYNIDLEDPVVYEGFKNPKKLFGVFQFDGQSTNQVCRQMMPSNFEELSAVNALSRPGPMHGMDLEFNQPVTSIYIARKWGKMPKKSAHPLLDKITDETQGVIVYQEQVMKTMRELGKMSWKDTADIRKAISKSQGLEAFDRYKAVFSVGAKENGLTEKEIDSIWASVCTFGSWAFNKSHSVSYTIISYWTMWLKMYYPIEYYAAMASVMNNEARIKRVIKEYIREGNHLLPIDVNKSKASFSIDNNQLRLGLSQVRGIGEGVAEEIVKNQPYSSLDDFKERSGLGLAGIKSLAKLKAFNSIGGTTVKTTTLFGTEERKLYDDTISVEEKIKLCPLSMDFNIVDKWGAFVEKYIKFPVSKIEHLDPEQYSQVIHGIIYDKNLKDVVEEAMSRGREVPEIIDGQSKYCNFILEDDTDFVTIRVSKNNFAIFKSLIFENSAEGDVFLIKGRMGDGIRMFFANEIVNLNHMKARIDAKETLKNYTRSELILGGKIKETKRKY